MPRVALTRALPETAMRDLGDGIEAVLPESPRDRLDPAALREHVAGADALISMLYDRIDEGVLEAAGPQLRVVANVAVGYDNIDVAAARAHGVTVTNTPGVLTDATADLTLGLILMTTRRLSEGERLIRSGAPWRWELDFMLGQGLQEKTLGIVGMGAIGTAVARRARAFGMRIAYVGRRPIAADLARELGAERMDLEGLLGSADVVSLHCPLSPETHHLIDAAALAKMPAGSCLVNTARGPVVDEEALALALREGRIAGAGLDVFEHEPAVHPDLLELENVVLVPHLGSATSETRAAMAELAVANVAAVLRGDAPLTPVG
jgi:lactate dehydrogenase-like 2-hydroxyacid dehydrogenase